jgi:hypothetical protein
VLKNLEEFLLDSVTTARNVAAISLVIPIVEALPYQDIDNITLTAVAIWLGWWLF